uniref:Uncharacterized protein n=1 Tax=viral metagenome TaxID=1070528 RepID=A0A6C0DQB3_9ZZZZ
MSRIVLLTMVKNESRIIRRLLDSVKTLDGIVVCDTGSTDNTVSLAKSYLKESGLPGTVVEYPFETFGKSRTKSFHSCQEWVASVGWDPSQTWALVIDGDMILKDPMDRVVFSKLGTNVAGVSLKQMNGSLLYSNVRVLRCSEPWICKGATHEAWTCPSGKTTQLLESPVLGDYGDGGCKSDKYERDVRLLKQDLEEMPNDARTHFYLGQTYLCMKNWEKAIETLQKRVDIGGWEEETYMAYVYIGEAYENLGKKDQAIGAWMRAWQMRQHRSEAPMRAVRLYRSEPKSQFLAMMLLEKYYSLQFGENFLTGEVFGPPLVNNDLLFVNRRDFQHSLWEELGILAFYNGPAYVRAAWLRLDGFDMKNTLGWHDMNGILGNMHWYDWCLKPKRQTRIQIPLETLPWAKEENGSVWQPFNPSIRINPEGTGYWLNIRYANYYTLEAKHYHYRGFQGEVLTRNIYCTYDSDDTWNSPLTMEEVLIDPQYKQQEGSYIRGVEDCRFIQGSDSVEYIGTSKSYSNNGSNKMFRIWKKNDAWHLKQLDIPPGVSPEETQKNWMGFRESGKLKYIYKYTPFMIQNEDGSESVFSKRTEGGEGSSYELKESRGSAGPVPWTSSHVPEEAYLCVLHKVYIGGDGRRYYHRFMTLDSEMKPSRVSCFVRMTKEKVEYWSGMCPSISGDSYWITYGLKDSEGYLAEMPKEEIESLMFYNLKGPSVPSKEQFARLKNF